MKRRWVGRDCRPRCGGVCSCLSVTLTAFSSAVVVVFVVMYWRTGQLLTELSVTRQSNGRTSLTPCASLASPGYGETDRPLLAAGGGFPMASPLMNGMDRTHGTVSDKSKVTYVYVMPGADVNVKPLIIWLTISNKLTTSRLICSWVNSQEVFVAVLGDLMMMMEIVKIFQWNTYYKHMCQYEH